MVIVLTLVAAPLTYQVGRSRAVARQHASFIEPAASAPSPGAAVGDTTGTTSPPAGAPAVATVEGDCNAVGNGNTVTCGRLSMDNIEISDGQVYQVWFDGPPADLPIPPSGETSLTYPCGDWYQWLRAQPGIYFEGPSKVVTLTAGEPDLVTLTDVKVMVTKRTARDASHGTYIKCNWGGGSHKSFHVYVDTLNNKTTLRTMDPDDSEGPARPMPPAAIALGGLESASAEVRARSVPGHIYEGYLMLTTSRNGKTETLRVGTAAEPLRWIASKSDALEEAAMYGWDPAARSWVEGFDPFGSSGE